MIKQLYLTSYVKEAFLWACILLGLHIYTIEGLDLENYTNNAKNIISLGALFFGLIFFFLSINEYQRQIKKWSHIKPIEFDDCHLKIEGNCENIFLIIQEEAKEPDEKTTKRFTMYFDSNGVRYVTTIKKEKDCELNEHEKLFLCSKYYHFSMDKMKSAVVSLDQNYFGRKDITRVPTRYAIELQPEFYYQTRFEVIA